MSSFIYEVREHDGTSFSGQSKLIGFFLNEENAKREAEAVKARDSWNEGSVRRHDIIDSAWRSNE